MRLSTYACLALPALAYSSAIPSNPQPALVEATITSSPSLPLQTTSSTQNSLLPELTPTAKLELRQEDVEAATTLAATQVNPVTTLWLPSNIGTTVTWVEVIYTQTFASVIDQWTTSGSGSVGMGTLTGEAGALKTSEARSSAAANTKPMTTNFVLVGGVAMTMMVLGAVLL